MKEMFASNELEKIKRMQSQSRLRHCHRTVWGTEEDHKMSLRIATVRVEI